MPHVALIIGHTASSPGAVSVNGTTEHAYNSILAAMIEGRLLELGLVASVVHRPEPNQLRKLPGLVNRTGCDFAVSLHFNSFGNPRAWGAEVLYWRSSSKGKRLAQLIQGQFVGLGFVGRGVKPIDWWDDDGEDDDRGDVLLGGTTMPCVLCEPGFGTNPRDWELLSDMAEIAGAYVRGIVAYASEMGGAA